MLKPSTNSSSLASEAHLCAFCTNQGNYSCPRCESLYCSLACYKGEKHLLCSERFYKKNVAEETAFDSSTRLNPDKIRDQKKVLDIVERYGSESEGWRYETPQGVDLNTIKSTLDATPTEAESGVGDGAEWTQEEEKELQDMLDKVPAEELWKVLSEEDQQRFLQFAKMNGV